jgi:tRNA1(Val) A37 N6-methylase TrmN6
MANPPYIESWRANPNSLHGKELSHVEGDVTLEHWAKFALLMVRPKGLVTFIYRADRLDHVLQYLSGKLGEITIYPLWPGERKSAKRVLIRGRKNSNAPTTLASGMILHMPDGQYTHEAEAVLRHGAGLYF